MQMIINGKYLDASDGKKIEVYNPYNGELIDTVPSATFEDAQLCLEAAYNGKAAWAATPVYDRAAIIRKFAANLLADKSRLGKISTAEMGKPIRQTNIEAWCLATIAEAYAEKAMQMYGEILPRNTAAYKDDNIITVRDPLGVVCCILPFNFPVYIAAHKVIPALLMGNTVILKPSSSNPLTLIEMTKMLHEAGVPAEALHVITGSGTTLGDWLVDSDKINAVAFTGSTETGIHIAERAAKNLHHVMLECGGNDPFIVCEDADIDLAVREAIAGRLANGGQVCCSPKRFIVNKAVKKEFAEKLLAALQTIKPGDPTDPATFIGTLIDAKAAAKCAAQVQHTVDQGAELLLGGTADGAVFYPALLDKVTPDMDIANNMEVFGACLPIIEVESDAEAVKIANQTHFGLSGAVFSTDLAKATRIASRIEAGSVVVNGNDSNNRHSYESFGGYKLSGYGREGVGGTLEEMSQVKTIVIKNFWKD